MYEREQKLMVKAIIGKGFNTTGCYDDIIRRLKPQQFRSLVDAAVEAGFRDPFPVWAWEAIDYYDIDPGQKHGEIVARAAWEHRDLVAYSASAMLQSRFSIYLPDDMYEDAVKSARTFELGSILMGSSDRILPFVPYIVERIRGNAQETVKVLSHARHRVEPYIPKLLDYDFGDGEVLELLRASDALTLPQIASLAQRLEPSSAAYVLSCSGERVLEACGAVLLNKTKDSSLDSRVITELARRLDAGADKGDFKC